MVNEKLLDDIRKMVNERLEEVELVERNTALKIIGLIESIRTRSRSQLDEALEQLIKIIKMTFIDYGKEKLIQIDQYGKVGVVEENEK